MARQLRTRNLNDCIFNKAFASSFLICLSLLLSACGSSDSVNTTDNNATDPNTKYNPDNIISSRMYNPEALIPPMCYTRTHGKYNPCYTCHQSNNDRIDNTNYMDDGNLQGEYTFSPVAEHNHWLNVFKDRSIEMQSISDFEINTYVNQDNYSSLAARLDAQNYLGYIPRLANLEQGAAAFDSEGFALDNSHWVAFNYKPLPSTFWPTNGSTDDVLIRLPAKFRQDINGAYSRDVYIANLSIVEAAIKDLESITTPAIDENIIGSDLNGNASFEIITQINRPQNYVGQAADTPVSKYLYPENVEFLHTVRYLGVNESNGEIYIPPRMKEVRYMKKFRFYEKVFVADAYAEEQLAKEQGDLPEYAWNGDKGMANDFGWLVQGFIEDVDGELRPQTYEEHAFCMGCHSSIGATIDQTFSFARKVTGAQGWGYINLKGMQDSPAKGETEGEFLQYLRRVGGGDEFRQNQEMLQRWFVNGDPEQLDEVKVKAAADIYELIAPSERRALDLNKAYRLIVNEQSYYLGRDAILFPSDNVYEGVDPELVPVLPVDKQEKREIFLEW